MSQTRAILRWSAYEHDHVPRGSDWFLALGIVTVCIAIISILFHDFLFAVVIIVAATTIGLMANVPPDLSEFEVSERGVRINGRLHRYHDIITFWVEDEHYTHHPLLLIDTTKFMHPNIIIPLEHIDPGAVRTLLKEHVEELPMKEPVAHKILEFLGL